MTHVTAATIPMTYIIPVGKSINATGARYHAELHNMTLGTKTNYAAVSIVPAVAYVPAVGEIPAIAASTGTVNFGVLSLPNDGAYLITVMYANNDDLNTASFETLTTGFVQRVIAAASIVVK